MEILTKSPYGDPPHVVISRACGIRKCRRSTPCNEHDQVIVRLCVDGHEKPEFKLGKDAFAELEKLHRDPAEMFHVLADFAILADGTPEMLAGQPGLADVAAGMLR